MLDAKSLMRASACCIMFKKCAMDPLCYSHIDLTTGNAGTRIVRNMILTAGKELRWNALSLIFLVPVFFLMKAFPIFFSICYNWVFLIISLGFVDSFRSLKVGCPGESSKAVLSGSCLTPLFHNRGCIGYSLYYQNSIGLTIHRNWFRGFLIWCCFIFFHWIRKLLRSLHLYDNKWLDKNFLLRALSVCSNLTDLKIVGL